MPEHTKSNDENVLKIIGHSKIIYWWPAWFFGYTIAAIAYFFGDQYLFSLIKSNGANWYTLLNFMYILLLLFIITVTNIKMELLPTIIVFMLIFIIYIALIAFSEHFNLLKDVPGFFVFVNKNFYIAFSTGLLIVWLVSVFIVDRLTVWELQPGVLIHRRRVSRQVIRYNLEGAGADISKNDVPCHAVLGLGAMGDITFRIAVPQPSDLPILNVNRASSKLQNIQQRIEKKKGRDTPSKQ